jgi:hypothetical protein
MLSWLEDDLSSERSHHTKVADAVALAACVVAALLLLHHHTSAGVAAPDATPRALHAAALHHPSRLPGV